MYQQAALALLIGVAIVQGSVIYTAQCRSRCYRIFYKNDIQTSHKRTKNTTTDSAPCHFSCKYIKRLYRDGFLPGTCSLKKQPHEDYCRRNIGCTELTKCCYGYCKEISLREEGVRTLVTNVTNSSLIARWQPSSITYAIFIIQMRVLYSTTIYYTDDEWGRWKQIKQGPSISGIRITHIHPGARLQLRVAIVNSSGLQSIGPATPVIQTLFEAKRPSGPEKIWILRRTYKESTVNVTLSWLRPAVLDVPVHSYRLFWKETPLITSHHSVLVKKHTRVQGSQMNYTITGLKKDTTYLVEIQAVCHWKKRRLKGPKVPLNVSTSHLKDTDEKTITYFSNIATWKDKKLENSSIFQDEKADEVEVFLDQNQKEKTEAPSRSPEGTTRRNLGRKTRSSTWTTTLIIILVLLFAW